MNQTEEEIEYAIQEVKRSMKPRLMGEYYSKEQESALGLNSRSCTWGY